MSAIRYWFCIGMGVLGMVAGAVAPEARAADRDLLVSTVINRSVLRFDGATGAYLGSFVAYGSGGLRQAAGLTYGPDGNLYVGDSSGGLSAHANVKRYNGRTGAPIPPNGDFVSDPGLFGARDVAFGPDGNLYVTATYSNQLRCYDGTTGALIRVFGPDRWGAAFKGDILYTMAPPGILRYSVTTGAYIDIFIEDPRIWAGGQYMVFGLDGNLYITDGVSNNVLRYDGTTGAFIDYSLKTGGAGALHGIMGLAFGPDGNLYVVSNSDNRVQRYDGTTGAFLDPFVESVGNPADLLFMPHPADFDADEDVDVADFGRFQACVTGPAVPYDPAALPPGCTMPVNASGRIAADFDQDGDVDANDFGVFQRCYSGANHPANTRCLE